MPRSSFVIKLILAVSVSAGAAAAIFWWPALRQWTNSAFGRATESAMVSVDGHDDDAGEGNHADDEHEGHAHKAHDEGSSLELSAAARRNLGLTPEYLQPVRLSTYRKTITVPAIVAGRPGRTEVEVSTPLTGVVTHVHAVAGEAVTPGTLLFEIRLTHEELVTAQTEFLRTLGELDVEKLEITRLEAISESGAISARTLLDRKYSRDKLEANIRAQREALKLHGLSDRQIDEIAQEKRLLRSLLVVAPETDEHDHEEELKLSGETVIPVSYHQIDEAHADTNPLIVGELAVRKGQAVAAGDKLCVVSDLENLFIEGHAFEQDGPAITQAIDKQWTITAVFPGSDGDQIVSDLPLVYIDTEVDLNSRSLSFFVDLPNTKTRDVKNSQGQRFVSWKYRPGQRLQLQVPVEEWPDQIVVPVDAVIREGADWYVFQQNGGHFDRLAVHVKHRDQRFAVIANDGAIFPGDVIALRSAHQMQMALKNKSGAGADPHAGHSH
ncbi:MAG: efflux RND transporter periplasmic adaptor subunit [Planctomyces sp.]|nr:efflux RND transporter periplasmic adaptor subunit [Planctomyces sp.]